MNVSTTLEELKNLILAMKNLDHKERLVSYSIIVSLISRLDEISKDKNIQEALYGEYRLKLLWHCEAVCGLDDGNGHDLNQHVTWALGEIGKMESVHCFNV